jgi:hypothetical protein
LTESSNPIRAKNASAAPERIASGTVSPALNSSACPASPPPSSRYANPITVTSSRPVSSIEVSPRLMETDSLIPRKLISASTPMNAAPTTSFGSVTNSDR